MFPEEQVAENWRAISWKFTSGYSDIGPPLENLAVGMRVRRGQVLAYQGHYRHTHFFLHLQDPAIGSVFLDPYRDMEYAMLDFFPNQDNRTISQGSPGLLDQR